MISFLQINLSECRAAHDLLLATATQLGVDVLLVSEPNRALSRSRDDWFLDASGRAAIAISGNLAIDAVGKPEPRFVWLEIGGIRVYSCYWSPNLPGHTRLQGLQG